jgi:DinB superfamily
VIDHCEECGFDGRDLSLAEIIEALRPFPDDVAAIVADCDAVRLRTRPTPGSWSALEYVLHLRDLMAYHRWLIERAMAEDEPVVATADPDAAIAGIDASAVDLEEVLGQLSRRVERFCSLIEGLDDAACSRRVVIAPGAEPLEVRLVARSAQHEAHHHRGDLVRIVGGPATASS